MYHYQTMDGISPSYYDDALAVSKDGSVGFLKPKKKSIQHKCGKKELTATIQLSRQLTTLWNRYAYFIVGAVSDGMGGEYEAETVFDPLDAANRLKAELEEKSAYSDEDRYDLFGSVPVGTKRLSDSQVKHRILLFVKLCNACAADEVMKYIIEKAAKKANGTFAKNRITRIATLCCLNYSSEVFELVGMAKSDTEIEIKVREVGFNHKSMELMESDIISETDLFKKVFSNSTMEDEEDDEIESMKAEFRIGDISVQVPVLPLQNGDLCIDAKPYIPITSFHCIQKQGPVYEISIPAQWNQYVEYSTGMIEVACGFEYKLLRFWAFFSEIATYIYAKDKKKAQKWFDSATKDFYYVSLDEKKRDLMCRSEQFISEVVYLMLGVLDYLHQAYPKRYSEIAGRAVRKKDGTLYTGKNFYEYAPLSADRKRGAFYCLLVHVNQNSNTIGISAEFGVHEDWTLN